MINPEITLLDKLPTDIEEKMNQDLISYEVAKGIDVNYNKFSLILTTATGETIGVLNAYTAFAEIYIDDLWVDSAYRGKGYGRQLMQNLEERFQGQGFNNINLVTSAFQAPELYRKCGYTEEFVRDNILNPMLSKSFFVKYFDDAVQNQGLLSASHLDD